MVQIDVPAAFGVGCVFADAARRQLQSGAPALFHDAWVKQSVFQTFFFVWIPIYFIANYFGWETTHMWWHEGAVWAYPYYLPVFVLVFFMAANAGFLLGVYLVRSERVKVVRGIYFGILFASAAWILGQWGRSARLGSYDEWKAGEAVWFYQDDTFLFMLIFVMLVWMTGLGMFYYWLYKAGKALPS